MTATPRPRRTTARELIAEVLDGGTFVSWDRTPETGHLPPSYRDELAAAAAKSGTDESIITGEGRVNGRRVAVAVSEFGFLGGSIGMAAADRLVRLFDRAATEGLAVLASPASGGTRMQEGTPAFVSMVGISAAVRRHRLAGLPYLVYLRDPTTGGVMASWGSQGHVTVAQPGALLGFLGPRVYETIYGRPFPAGVQVAENLQAKGLIDAVVPLSELAGVVDRALRILAPADSQRHDGGAPAATPPTPPAPAGPEDVWRSIEATRATRRPSVRHLLKYGASDILPLSGTAQGERDPSMFLALARLGGRACVVVGQDRRPERSEPLGPAFLREARRGMRLAEQLSIPLVTVIDTEGAALSREAEEGGLAGEIARSITELIGLRTATVSVLLGQGTGGGALALLPADRTIAAANAWLSPLPPEGASAIVYRDTEHAAQLAAEQHVDSASLFAAGIVDTVVPEPGPADERPREFSRDMADAVAAALAEVSALPLASLLAGREHKYARIGLPL
ncbi:carboxyl transferase domain-containing protein [Zhihengliuella halotolerans]|uniref:Acetyl-CoA carboxylase carboxyl transferase subunit beta n=1 Tax=Zhihengliuella halotolerans TaxID=370736 RepID=A0A4Q8AG52_9MICC|nr:carboxyl transferase domain-containing protein [Zhihengliuella halotolerans]RZU63332.1 acetyl-CoA carboxylase carboxyl transferase subunit beta [Zhihengliuella halotolerans]